MVSDMVSVRSTVIKCGAAFAALSVSALFFPVFSGFLTCDAVTEPRLAAAIVEGRALAMRVWRPFGGGFLTAYKLGGAQPIPLGLSKLPQFQSITPPPGAEKPIEGLLAVQALDCTVHEQGPPTAYVVRLIGRGLTFREGGLAWTPRQPRGIIQGFELVVKADSVGLRSPSDLRSALPPDARLSLPPETVSVPPVSKSQRDVGR
jgi:hypothetical protein